MTVPGQPPPGQQPGQSGYPSQPPQPQWGSYRHRYAGPQPAPAPAAAVKPGIVPLAPLNLGTILSGAFSMYKFNPAAMIGIPLLLFGILAVLGAPLGFLLISGLDASVDDPFQILGQSLLSLLGLAALSLISCAIIPFVAGSVHASVLGRKLTAGEIWSSVRARVPAVIGYVLLIGLLMVVSSALLVLPAVVLSEELPLMIISTVLLSLIYSVGWIWLATKLLLAPAAIAVESLGPIAAIRRSIQLTRGGFWPILGTYLLTSLIVSVAQQLIAGLASVPIAVAATVVGYDQPDALIGTIMMPAAFLSMAIAMPFTYAVVTLIYIDRRIKQEAYDVELGHLAMPAPPPPGWGRPY